jgi:hypothetical protein
VPGTGIGITSESFAKGSDKSWIGTRMGLSTMRSITLDISTFDAEHVAGGYIPSGIVLGIITATGKYGPYEDAALDGRQVARGHLFEEVKVNAAATDADCGAALFWTGVVKLSKLPQFTGTGNNKGEADAAAQVDLTAWIRYEA